HNALASPRLCVFPVAATNRPTPRGSSEVKLQAELDLARVIGLWIGDLAKGRAVDAAVDATQSVAVENVEHRGTNLGIPLLAAEIEVLQNGEVFVEQSGSAKLRDPSGSIAVLHVGWTAESRRVDVRESAGIVGIELRILQWLAGHEVGPRII